MAPPLLDSTDIACLIVDSVGQVIFFIFLYHVPLTTGVIIAQLTSSLIGLVPRAWCRVTKAAMACSEPAFYCGDSVFCRNDPFF